MRRQVWTLGLVVVGLVLACLVRPVLENGDSAVYNDQIENGPLGHRTVHFGYMLLGRVFHLLLPGATDWQMNVMTVAVGTSGALAVYATTHALTRSGAASLVAGLGVFAAPAYLRGTLMSEVDVPLAAFVALAFAAWFRGRTKLAAALYGYAMLISPLASLGLPAFLFTARRDGDSTDARLARLALLRRLALFGLVSLAVYLPVVVAYREDYLFGGRGLFRAPRSPYDLGAQVERSARFFGGELSLVFLWAVGAVIAFIRRFRAWLAGIAAVALVSVLVGERFKDVPVQLTTTVLAAPLVGLNVDAILALWPTKRFALRVAAVAALLTLARALGGMASDAFDSANLRVRRLERERDAYLELSRTFPDGVTLVHSQGFGQARTFERTVYRRTRGEHVISYPAFREGCADYATKREAFWLAQKPYDAPCPELAERTRSTVREFHGTRFHLLEPSDAP